MVITKRNAHELCELLLATPWEERLATANRHAQVRERIDAVLKVKGPSLANQSLIQQVQGIRRTTESRLRNTDPLSEELLSAIATIVVLLVVLALNVQIVTSRGGFLAFLGVVIGSFFYWRHRIRKARQYHALFGRKTSATLSTGRLWLAYTDTVLRPLREALRVTTPVRPSAETGYRPVPMHPQLVLAQQDLQILEARQRAGLGIIITLLETHDGSSHAIPYAIADNDPRSSDQILRDALKLVESAERECCSSTSVRVADEQPPIPGAALYEHLRGTDKKKTA